MKQLMQEYIKQHAHIHLIGIGGVSMNSLAELLLARGAHVTGSDRKETEITDRLEHLGATIIYEHIASNVEGADLIVRTAAVHDDNPEIIRAHELSIPVMERAEAWGELMRDYHNVICLSGTHGKTTSTSMMTMIAMQAGLDPTVMVGSHLPAINGTLRIGDQNCFIAESCEYCNSFLSFCPTISVILNVEADHLDFFKDIDSIIESFHKFCLLTPKNGAIVVNADDANAMKAVENVPRTIKTFGMNANAYAYPANLVDEHGYYRFDVMIDGKFYTHMKLSVPGLHNVKNALACCAASAFLGISGMHVSAGLEQFTGSTRRFQKTGNMKCGALVVDDYAHHPSEMRATLSAAREMGFSRILCIFQPHTYTRTKALFDDFVRELSACDQAILAPIYAAREKNTIGIYSSDLANNIPGALSFNDFNAIISYVQENARAGDLILTMGAGNINEIGSQLICESL